VILKNKIPDGGGSGRLKPPLKHKIGGNMNILDQIEHLWTDHKKLVIAVVVIMVLLAIA